MRTRAGSVREASQAQAAASGAAPEGRAGLTGAGEGAGVGRGACSVTAFSLTKSKPTACLTSTYFKEEALCVDKGQVDPFFEMKICQK